jgi:hypothetical protein
MPKNWKKTTNNTYINKKTKEEISKTKFVQRIKIGQESKDYEIYKLDGKKFPRSKKDNSTGNNLLE